MKLIADWAKWLITIETAVTVAIGVLFTSGHRPWPAKLFGTVTVGSFLVSAAAAAMLLLTLPDIVQRLKPGEDVWLTRDSVAGPLLRMNTQSLALIEAFFFGVGLLSVAAMAVTLIWA